MDTKTHFKKLIEIVREDGILTALDYDYQLTRLRNPLFNRLMEDIEYLQPPTQSHFIGSPARKDFLRIHDSKYYVAFYSGAIFHERLVDLILK